MSNIQGDNNASLICARRFITRAAISGCSDVIDLSCCNKAPSPSVSSAITLSDAVFDHKHLGRSFIQHSVHSACPFSATSFASGLSLSTTRIASVESCAFRQLIIIISSFVSFFMQRLSYSGVAQNSAITLQQSTAHT